MPLQSSIANTVPRNLGMMWENAGSREIPCKALHPEHMQFRLAYTPLLASQSASNSRMCSRLPRQLQQVAPRQLQRRRDGAQARVRAAQDVDHRALLPRVLHNAQLVRQQRHARVPRRRLRRQRACTA